MKRICKHYIRIPRHEKGRIGVLSERESHMIRYHLQTHTIVMEVIRKDFHKCFGDAAEVWRCGRRLRKSWLQFSACRLSISSICRLASRRHHLPTLRCRSLDPQPAGLHHRCCPGSSLPRCDRCLGIPRQGQHTMSGRFTTRSGYCLPERIF